MSNKEDHRRTSSGKSSAPPESAQLETNWDDETVPGLDLDDPLNEFDRVTAIPELPPDLYAKQVMETAENDRASQARASAGSVRPPITLQPDEYFSLDSPMPPPPIGNESTMPPGGPSMQSALTARPNAVTVPVPAPVFAAQSGLGDLDSIGSLKTAAPPSLGDAVELEFEDTEPSEPFKQPGPHADLKDRYAMGDFSGALVVAEGILESDPRDVEAKRYAQTCRDVLTQMYSARLGSLDQIVAVAVPGDQIRWLTLDHRAGFLLSLIDGGSTIDQILDISGMARLDALRIIYQLVDQRVISLGA